VFQQVFIQTKQTEMWRFFTNFYERQVTNEKMSMYEEFSRDRPAVQQCVLNTLGRQPRTMFDVVRAYEDCICENKLMKQANEYINNNKA
jgi:hypothetical protein